MKHFYNFCIKKQSGVVLFTSLIMLLLLTIIGIAGIQTATLEEKMASSVRDRNIAFQAAEAALRDAERDIRGQRNAGAVKLKIIIKPVSRPLLV